jgi:ferredoxin
MSSLPPPDGTAATVAVRIEPLGLDLPAPRDVPLLKAAADAGVVLPSSCRNGTCRTCMCLATGGTVRYRIEWPGLSAEEKREGWVLPCVALAEGPLTLHVPHARRA